MSAYSSYDFVLSRGDTSPSLVRSLLEDDDSVSLVDATSVTFELYDPMNLDDPIETKDVVVEDDDDGVVRLDWSAEMTDRSGSFLGRFVVDWGTSTESFPNHKHLDIYIH